jgi:hypothetical protein
VADPDDDGDRLSDTWEVEHGLDPLSAGDALADPDEDGVATVDEVLAGFDAFDLQSCPGCLTLDVDGDGRVRPLTDGLLALRYLFGLSGAALTAQAVDESATRSDPIAVAAYLTRHVRQLDIDGDGAGDPLSDGLLLLRYLFGFRDQVLAADAVASGATRASPEEIERFLEARTTRRTSATPISRERG